MNKSILFKKAHALTKSIIQPGDNYRVTFGEALRMIISESKSISPEKLESIGGKLWERGDLRRIYFNNLEDFCSFGYSRYNSGSIKRAFLNGEKISNRAASALLYDLEYSKVFFDLVEGQFKTKMQGRAIELESEIVDTIRSRAMSA